MDWYEPEVRALEQRQQQHPAPQGVVAFYGSSTITLWDTLTEDFPGVPLVNLGFGGSTLRACSWFFWRLVEPVAPACLILYAGDNDIGDDQPVNAIVDQFDHLAQQLDLCCPGIPLGWISIKPSPARFGLVDRIRSVNSQVRARLAQRPRGVYVDLEPVMLSAGSPRPELYEPDGLHLNRAGYRVLVAALLEHAEPLLLRPRREPS